MTHDHCPIPRRQMLLACASFGIPAWALADALQPRTLSFPRDHGTHNDMRTEWWYLTGHGESLEGQAYGFQVTFFRSRVPTTQGMRSRLAAKHILFAHAAITDVQGKRLWHDQRIARWNGEPPTPGDATMGSEGTAFASNTDTQIALQGWSLKRLSDGRYRAQVNAEHLSIDLHATPTQALLLQGQQGFSRKGPDTSQSSFYVSHPQLAVNGSLKVEGQVVEMRSGRAWLDHEWSESLMHPEAVGWDWMGMNLSNGDSLTAFRMRRANGSAIWSGGSWRSKLAGENPSGAQSFGPTEVQFEPLRYWVSPQTQARYPVAWRVTTPAGKFTVQALVDAQELDNRQGTGTVYWEGLSELLDAQGHPVGRGYLEMTGYAQPLKL